MRTSVAPFVLISVVLLFAAACDGEDGEPRFEAKMAFGSDRDGSVEIYIMNGDGTGQRRLSDSLRTNHLIDPAPTWSPEGKQIAFRGVCKGIAGLCIMNADGSGLIRLATGGLGDPAWSPNPRRIAFSGFRGDNLEIFAVNTDGTDLVNVTNHPAADVDPDWSPDGRRIAFASERDGNPEIYVMNADGSHQTRLTYNRSTDAGPAWSPAP